MKFIKTQKQNSKLGNKISSLGYHPQGTCSNLVQMFAKVLAKVEFSGMFERVIMS